VDLLERIDVLLKQELSNYRTEDYLDPAFQRRLQSTVTICHGPIIPKLEDNSSACSSSGSSSVSGISELWREKICEWSYQVIDHFDFSREVVSVSIHYLDRFLATRPVNKKMFQLAAMTTLFLAIKLYEPSRISMKSMIELSRGYFMVEQMVAMEMAILRALSWKVHPVTAYCFSKHTLFLLPYTSVSMEVRQEILELSRFFTELSVLDYYFVSRRPSSVALAALLESMLQVTGMSEESKNDFLREIQRVDGLDPESIEVDECRQRLKLLYAQGGYGRTEELSTEIRSETISPVCVSYGVNPFATPKSDGRNAVMATCATTSDSLPSVSRAA